MYVHTQLGISLPIPIVLFPKMNAYYSFDINSPRVAEPAGCNGQSYRSMNETVAAADCKAGCKQSTCLAPFYNGGYYYAICEC